MGGYGAKAAGLITDRMSRGITCIFSPVFYMLIDLLLHMYILTPRRVWTANDLFTTEMITSDTLSSMYVRHDHRPCSDATGISILKEDVTEGPICLHSRLMFPYVGYHENNTLLSVSVSKLAFSKIGFIHMMVTDLSLASETRLIRSAVGAEMHTLQNVLTLRLHCLRAKSRTYSSGTQDKQTPVSRAEHGPFFPAMKAWYRQSLLDQLECLNLEAAARTGG